MQITTWVREKRKSKPACDSTQLYQLSFAEGQQGNNLLSLLSLALLMSAIEITRHLAVQMWNKEKLISILLQ